MPLRPLNAKWFELLTAREELAATLRCLAGTGQVELQSHSVVSATQVLPVLRAAIDEYLRLAQRYKEFWPAAARTHADVGREPLVIANSALQHLQAWASESDPLILRLQQLALEQSGLELCRDLLSRSDIELPDLSLFSKAGPLLESRTYLLAPETSPPSIPPSVLVQWVPCDQRMYLLAVGAKAQMQALDDNLNASKARRFELPTRLLATRTAALDQITARQTEATDESRQLGTRLAELHDKHEVSAALADLAFIEWVVHHVPEFAATEHFAWITGWTSDLSGTQLQSALERGRLHGLLRFPDAPPGLVQPVVLRNPRWAQPFELFARMLGVPAASDVDPSRIVALLAPVMFGFMFGDVGQGAMLAIAGVVLRKKHPGTRMLIPGGLLAMLFGVLFGSVFADENILPALWLRPIDQPLLLLGVSLAFGACVIMAGLILDGLQYHWVGKGGRWRATRAGLLLCYAGMVLAALDARALWALPLGLAWHWVGTSAAAPPSRHLQELAAGIGESLETLLQLSVNTLSFMRVGAFALAHAGLAAALGGLVAGIGSRPIAWLVLALGNVLIVVVEGLVVSIQTTRLVLFEFFIRFLHGTGRPFRPLPALDPLNPSRKHP